MIVRFDPVILGDPGVVFCTTNNAYPTVQRGEAYPALIRCLPLRCRGAVWDRFPLGGIERLTRQPTRKQKFCTLANSHWSTSKPLLWKMKASLRQHRVFWPTFLAHQPTVDLDPEAF